MLIQHELDSLVAAQLRNLMTDEGGEGSGRATLIKTPLDGRSPGDAKVLAKGKTPKAVADKLLPARFMPVSAQEHRQ